MALAMLEAIRRRDPDATITWLCGEKVELLVRNLGGVNEIITANENMLLKYGPWKALRELLGVWIKLFGRRFDIIAIGHSDWRYRLLAWTAVAKVRRSFGVSTQGLRLVPGRYHVNEYVRLITGQDGPKTPNSEIHISMPPLPAQLRQKLRPGKKNVALAPGGAKNILRDDALRRWPLESYARLAEKLLKNGCQVIITGSVSDEWIRDSFKSLPVVDLVGQTSLLDLTALYGRCELVITHDSGPLHLAIAAGAPVISLFGPTIPWEKVPRNRKVRVIWGGEELACRPCYDGKNYPPCRDNRCLKNVTADEVHLEAVKILKTRRKP
jgi:heptosyltransferase II